MPPKALLRRVDPHDHLLPVWRAFWALNGDRQIGMGGCGPIYWSAINAYAQRYGPHGIDEFEWFEGLIRTLDADYIKHVSKDRNAVDQ